MFHRGSIALAYTVVPRTSARVRKQVLYNCGSTKHKRSECEAPGGLKHKPDATGGPQKDSVANPVSPKPSVGAPDVPNPKAAATKPEEILANAQAMLQGLRLSSVTASLPKWSAMRAASSTDAYVPSPPVPEAMMGLLDGGATNPLRTALMDELDHAAMGGTRLWINRTGTLLSDVEVDPMVPMGCLASELRCNVTWEGSLCRVRHPGRGWLDITMIGQCPYVDRSVALDLIQELEISETHKRSMKNTVLGKLLWQGARTIGCEILTPHFSALWLRCFRMLLRIRSLRPLALPPSGLREVILRGIGDLGDLWKGLRGSWYI